MVRSLTLGLTALAVSGAVLASSHMDAPRITKDPAANTTDLYAFVTETETTKYLVTALSVYPHQEPGVGPNHYAFLNIDEGRYAIHISDPNTGAIEVTYEFAFFDSFQQDETILQNYTGVVNDLADAAQNYVQRYSVTKIDRRAGATEIFTGLGIGTVPPNNQGNATPFYNQDNDGNNPAKEGVDSSDALDRYTQQAVTPLEDGYLVFAGQRDDGFYGDIQSIFDLLSLRSGDDRFDSQAGFNVMTMALAIPVAEIGGDMQQVGVWGASYRNVEQIVIEGSEARSVTTLRQVARQGNPLFNEALVAIGDSNLYNRTRPSQDGVLFRKYAETPELAALINALLFGGDTVAQTGDRQDLVDIFIPDVLRVDLSTGSTPKAGNGPDDPDNPDDTGFSRLSVFGGDTVMSPLVGAEIPAGWPNGRRFGDDVIDIAISAIVGMATDGIDNVSANDIGYNTTFPYAPTPQNGRNNDKVAGEQ